VELIKGFDVCGMMIDVFLSHKRNARSQVYDFVRFRNVQDVKKIAKALNDVWFGQF